MSLSMQILFILSWCFLVPGCLCAKVKPLKALLIEVGREASPDEMAKKESGEVDYDYEIDEENAKFKAFTDQLLIGLVEGFNPWSNETKGIKFSLEELVSLGNTRPEAIVLMSVRQLEGIMLKKPEILRNLTRPTFEKLVESRILAEKVKLIPLNSTAIFLAENDFVKRFMKHQLYEEMPYFKYSPGVQVFHDILRNETFLKMLPMHVHIELAESNFMKAISEDDIRRILRVRPDMLRFFGPKGMRFTSQLLQRPGFVDSLSCSVIMNAATNTTFIDMLSGPDLKALLRSINFWSCIPIDVIRTIMNNNKIGNKISLNDIIIAAPLLARTKKIDEDVIISLFQVQFPQIAQRGLLKSLAE